MSAGRESYRLQVIYPERRRRRRFLTLKNAGIAGIFMIVAVVLLEVWSAFRPHSASLSNLFSSAAPLSEASVRHDPMIVTEGSIYDHPGTDASLLDEDAQAKLRAPVPEPSSATAAGQTAFQLPASQLGKGQRITISGGSDGVQVHKEPLPAPAASAQAPPHN